MIRMLILPRSASTEIFADAPDAHISAASSIRCGKRLLASNDENQGALAAKVALLRKLRRDNCGIERAKWEFPLYAI